MASSVEKLKDCGINDIAIQSPHAVTIPGAISAWFMLNADHGKKGMDELLAPAIHYADKGFPIAYRVGLDWEGLIPKLMADPVSSKMMTVGGKAPPIGSIFRQPNLAKTLSRIAKEGRDAFYLGAVAEDIVGRLRAMGGLHTLDDFCHHQFRICRANRKRPTKTIKFTKFHQMVKEFAP